MRIVKKIIKIFLLSVIALILLGVGVTYIYGEKIVIGMGAGSISSWIRNLQKLI